jgi:menaquinone-dependent protoporphyrinogen IX oxidase
MDPSEVGGMFKNTKSQPGQIEIISGNLEVCKKYNYHSAAVVIS